MVEENEFAGKSKRLQWQSKMNHGRIFKEFIRKSWEMKNRDMFLGARKLTRRCCWR